MYQILTLTSAEKIEAAQVITADMCRFDPECTAMVKPEELSLKRVYSNGQIHFRLGTTKMWPIHQNEYDHFLRVNTIEYPIAVVLDEQANEIAPEPTEPQSDREWQKEKQQQQETEEMERELTPAQQVLLAKIQTSYGDGSEFSQAIGNLNTLKSLQRKGYIEFVRNQVIREMSRGNGGWHPAQKRVSWFCLTTNNQSECDASEESARENACSQEQKSLNTVGLMPEQTHQDIAGKCPIYQSGTNKWQVLSGDGQKYYTVRWEGDRHACNCKSHQFHPEKDCKHIEALKRYQAKSRYSYASTPGRNWRHTTGSPHSGRWLYKNDPYWTRQPVAACKIRVLYEQNGEKRDLVLDAGCTKEDAIASVPNGAKFLGTRRAA
ncbi:MAG: hypothetical protein J7647_27285 [Cyanobacteria bacterium SBLK]|nr:hypothetical protein [Cyanobacteria bacterium SBLK]